MKLRCKIFGCKFIIRWVQDPVLLTWRSVRQCKRCERDVNEG